MEQAVRKKTTFGIIWRIAVIVFGVFMCGVSLKGLYLLNEDFKNFKEKSIATKGKVVKIHYRRMSGAEERYYADPEVQFVTKEGDTVNFVDQSALDLGVVQGQEVDIHYMPDDPEYAKIDAPEQNDMVYLIMMMVFAAAFLLVAIIFGMGLRKYLKRPRA